MRLWSTYALQGSPAGGWKVGGGVTWRDSSLNTSNTVTSPSYAVWDAMASYEYKPGRQKLSFQLNVNNLFNRFYYTGADNYSAYGAYGVRQYGDPRSAMCSLRVEF